MLHKLAACYRCAWWTAYCLLWLLALFTEIGARRAGRGGRLAEVMRDEH